MAFLLFKASRIQDYIGECDLKLENYQGIIKHFKPIQFIIDEGDFKPYLRVHCECAWEEEHGLELVILKGKTIYVGSCSNEPIDWILDEENENEWNFA